MALADIYSGSKWDEIVEKKKIIEINATMKIKPVNNNRRFLGTQHHPLFIVLRIAIYCWFVCIFIILFCGF